MINILQGIIKGSNIWFTCHDYLHVIITDDSIFYLGFRQNYYNFEYSISEMMPNELYFAS